MPYQIYWKAMKRNRRLSKRWFVLVFWLGAPPLGTAQETEDAAIELSPSDFLPLEVGNRWTFQHWYRNTMFPLAENFHKNPEEWGEGEELTHWEAYFKQFEIPGYPPLGESFPPESLTRPDMIVISVEITHKEQIDGFDYFVFSGPSYSWPPLPTFFWAGQKVRFSEDGILHFHRSGTDIPLYDFRMSSERWHRYEVVTQLQQPPASGVIEMVRSISEWLTFPMFPLHLQVEKNPAYQFLEVGFSFSNSTFYNATEFGSDWYVQFVNGYGFGVFDRAESARVEDGGIESWAGLSNNLYPLSAVLSGNEISFEEAAEKLVLLIEPEFPPIVGQRDTLYRSIGFDFSEGESGSWYYQETDDVMLDQRTSYHEGYPEGPPYIEPYADWIELGQVDFERLASEGPPADLQPDPDSRFPRPQEGNTYAFWTHEGGVALVHVLDIVTDRGGVVVYVLFDWIYYPPSGKDTSIKPTSWGELKNSIGEK